jgi:hypothetical protein
MIAAWPGPTPPPFDWREADHMTLYELKAKFGFDSDKGGEYFTLYQQHLEPIRHQAIDLLEVGIHKGGSLQLWAEYMPEARIHGVDLRLPDIPAHPRIHMEVADQSSKEQLGAAMARWGVRAFDVIVDDASHFGRMSARTFDILFRDHLKPGGVYFVEDWGTGYWPDWPDGEAVDTGPRPGALDDPRPLLPPFNKARGEHALKSHHAGMVGFVKSLIDLLSVDDIRQTKGGADVAALGLEAIDFRPGIVAVRKRADAPAIAS